MRKGAPINRALSALITAAAVVVADQLSKALLTSALSPYETVEVISGFFNIVSVRNPGAAFGLFRSTGVIVLTVVSLLALVLIAVLIRQSRDRRSAVALAMVAGGAVGNLIDRLRFGEVIDFLDFYVGAFHWPAFNAADSAITVGVVLYLAFSFTPTAGKGR